MTSEEKKPLFGNSTQPESPEDFPKGYEYDVKQPEDLEKIGTFGSRSTKFIALGYTCAVSVCVLITIVLSIVRANQAGSVYLLLGINILCIGLVELGLIYLYKKEDLPREKMWFILLVGFCIFIEAVLTNIVLYSK